ncbi:MAG: hypothetical protein PHX70_14400 [Clostridium sp.]|nr:hypothetical protein [Clostridium sp.]
MYNLAKIKEYEENKMYIITNEKDLQFKINYKNGRSNDLQFSNKEVYLQSLKDHIKYLKESKENFEIMTIEQYIDLFINILNNDKNIERKEEKKWKI